MSYSYDTRVQRIARTLHSAGYDVTVLCPRYRGDPRRILADGIDVRFFPLPRTPNGLLGHFIEYTYSVPLITALSMSVFLSRGFDIIHICNPPDILFPLGWLYKLLGCRYVFDQHDLVPELFETRYGQRGHLTYGIVRGAERFALRIADHVLTTNETSRQYAIKRGGIQNNRLTIVSNGPDLSLFPTLNSTETANKGMTTVGYLGNMNPQDGLEYLLRAAHHIRYSVDRDDIRFVCIGSGSAYSKLRRLAAKLKLEGVVEFKGRLLPPAAFDVLAACDICVQPDPKNSFTDTCSMAKAFEYLALGKPVVAFDLKETQVTCGKAALFARENNHRDLAQQILKLADDATLRKRLGLLGRRRIEQRLAWAFSEPHLLEAYRRLTAKRQ